MNETYDPAFQKRQAYGRSGDGEGGFAAGFSLSLAGPYPSLEEELRKDVSILRSSLAVRDEYIDRLRKARESLVREIRVKEIVIDCQEQRIKGYQQLLGKTGQEHQQNEQELEQESEIISD
jgi:hypothetical protein